MHSTPGVTERPLRHLHAHYRNKLIEPHTIAINMRFLSGLFYSYVQLR